MPQNGAAAETSQVEKQIVESRAVEAQTVPLLAQSTMVVPGVLAPINPSNVNIKMKINLSGFLFKTILWYILYRKSQSFLC